MSKFIFLGTGTSSGIPVIGCNCEVCKSKDRKDKRLRTSGLFIKDDTYILIDVGPDFRMQSLKYNVNWIDGILITHSHQDHIGGIDELRQINFIMNRNIDVYGTKLSLKEIKTRFDYIFKKTQEGGGKPALNLILTKKRFKIKDVEIITIPVMHGILQINGYRIDDFSYITDASYIPEESLNLLKGTKILVINALRYRKHSTHFSISESLEIINQIKPKKTYLVHMTHDIKHSIDSKKLPENVYFAYDGLKINL